MNLPLTLGLDVLTDFIARAVDPSGGTLTAAVTPPTDTDQRRHDEDLKASERDALQKSDAALRQLTSQLRQALAERDTNPPTMDVVNQLQKMRDELRSRDGFGNDRRTVPENVDRAIAYLRTQAAQTEANATEELDPELEIDPSVDSELEALIAQSELGIDGFNFDDQLSPEEAQIQEFVQRYFSDRLDDGRPTDLSKPIPQSEPVVQGDESLQLFRGQLSPSEARMFVRLTPDERRQFLLMQPDEKKFVELLQPDEREYYFQLNPESRLQFRKLSPEVQKAKVKEQTQTQAQAERKPPEEVARGIADTLMRALDIPKGRSPELREKATVLAHNLLLQEGGDKTRAELGTLRALIADPKIAEPLLEDLQELLEEATSPNAQKYIDAETAPTQLEEKPEADEAEKKKPKKLTKGLGNYGMHFQRIRSTLPQLAQSLVQPGLNRDNLLQGMKKAVIVSADYLVNYPRKKATGKGDSSRFKHRFIAG